MYVTIDLRGEILLNKTYEELKEIVLELIKNEENECVEFKRAENMDLSKDKMAMQRLKEAAEKEKSTQKNTNTVDKNTLNLSDCRILLVEDNELNQEIAVAILEDEGYIVEVANNGQIAVDMISKSSPGYYKIVLMDIQMPVMNGYEATKAIRKLENKELASIPIIAMTANAFEEDKQEALRSGMNGHIPKPIDIDNLFSTLDRILK